jgi:Spy/CpxP family protein refolding chaperone
MTAYMLDLQFNTATVVALLTLAGVIFSSVMALAAAKHAKGSNVAVNNRSNGEPKIYDLALNTYKELLETRSQLNEQQKWHDEYEGGPLDTGKKVEDFVGRVEEMAKTCTSAKEDVSKIRERLDQIDKNVIKYGCPVKLDQSDNCLKGEN